MADVRKLLQAERRLRETTKSKPDRSAPGSSRASAKRSLAELDEAVGEITKRPRTTKPTSSAFYDADGAEAVKTARNDNTSPQNQRKTADVERDDASMAGASDTNANSSTLPSDFFGAGSAVPSNAQVQVDEDEWAAFQADVVESVVPVTSSVVIEAAPTTNNPAAAAPDEQDDVDDYARGEEEDAKQKLIDEFEEMEGLEQRVQRLKERREALKNKTPVGMELAVDQDHQNAEEDDEDEDEDEDDDEDDFFRVRGS